MRASRYLTEEELIERGLAALIKALGPVALCYTAARNEGIASGVVYQVVLLLFQGDQ